MMNDGEWINELKMGDKFVTHERYGNKFILHTITRITDKMIVAGNSRFWKKDGSSVGKDLFAGHDWMCQIDGKVREQLLRQSTRHRISKINIEKMPIERVRAIYTVLGDVDQD